MAGKRKKFTRVEVVPLNERCPFCENDTNPSYQRRDELTAYMTSRKRIVNSARSGFCHKHQKRLAKEIKRARYLALLPYTEKI